MCEHCYGFFKIFYSFIKNYVCIKEELKENSQSESADDCSNMKLEIKEESFMNKMYENIKIERDVENNDCDIIPATVKDEEIEIKSEDSLPVR